MWLLLSLLLVPDPGGKLLFARAQSLEARGLVQPAVRQYLLLAEAHATSPYAAQALLQAGDLMADLARAGDAPQFNEALATYEKLATTYPQHILAGTALLRAADILTAICVHRPERAPSITEYSRSIPTTASMPPSRCCVWAVSRRTSAMAKRRKSGFSACCNAIRPKRSAAPKRSSVWAKPTRRSSTPKNTKCGRATLRRTIKNYPRSVWASKAKERLGLMVWVDTAPRERRVQIETRPLPDEGTEAGSLLNAMRMVLAARGVLVNDTVLRGWGMQPFFAGYAPGQRCSDS
jgi:hypothetical protein